MVVVARPLSPVTGHEMIRQTFSSGGLHQVSPHRYIETTSFYLDILSPISLPAPTSTATMTTISPEGLQGLLEALEIGTPNPAFTSVDIHNNPVGIYFSHIAQILVQLTECEPRVAYDSISWANDFSHLVVVTPRLRLRDVNPEELAADLQQRVIFIINTSCKKAPELTQYL